MYRYHRYHNIVGAKFKIGKSKVSIQCLVQNHQLQCVEIRSVIRFLTDWFELRSEVPLFLKEKDNNMKNVSVMMNGY